MTTEEAIKCLKVELHIWESDCKSKHAVKDALKMAITALEQEPVFDKIKNEIDLETRIQVKHYTNTDAVIDAVLDVIGEYKS